MSVGPGSTDPSNVDQYGHQLERLEEIPHHRPVAGRI